MLTTWNTGLPNRLDPALVSFFLDKYKPRRVLDFCGADAEVAFQAKLRGIYPIHADMDVESIQAARARMWEFNHPYLNHITCSLASALNLRVGDNLLDPSKPAFQPGYVPVGSDVPLQQQFSDIAKKISSLHVERQGRDLLRMLLRQCVRRSGARNLSVELVEELVAGMRQYEKFKQEHQEFFNGIGVKTVFLRYEEVRDRFGLCITRPDVPRDAKQFYRFMKPLALLGSVFVFDVPASKMDMKAKTVGRVMHSLGYDLLDETTCEEKREERTTESTTRFILEYKKGRSYLL
jgi:hypothetical protein